MATTTSAIPNSTNTPTRSSLHVSCLRCGIAKPPHGVPSGHCPAACQALDLVTPKTSSNMDPLHPALAVGCPRNIRGPRERKEKSWAQCHSSTALRRRLLSDGAAPRDSSLYQSGSSPSQTHPAAVAWRVMRSLLADLAIAKAK